MLILALPLFLGTFLFALLIFVFYTECKHAKSSKNDKLPKITELPLITPNGQIINTVEELDIHIEVLTAQVEEKEKEVENSKNQLVATEENLKRLSDTTNKVKKYYMKLKSDVNKNETDCKELHNQIQSCLERQARLREEVNQNVKYYSSMLGNMNNSGDNSNFDKEYEVVPPAFTASPKKSFYN